MMESFSLCSAVMGGYVRNLAGNDGAKCMLQFASTGRPIRANIHRSKSVHLFPEHYFGFFKPDRIPRPKAMENDSFYFVLHNFEHLRHYSEPSTCSFDRHRGGITMTLLREAPTMISEPKHNRLKFIFLF